MRRREFLELGGAALAGVALVPAATAAAARPSRAPTPARPRRFRPPMVLTTWNFGLGANTEAMRVLAAGGSALDAVEAGIRLVESDPKVDSVGLGGLPNADGVVELDAAIVDGATLRMGSVAALRGIENPISVARRVMERTPHILLVGEGARSFALAHGFPERDLLTSASRAAWEKWRAQNPPPAVTAPASHDTIGMVAIDRAGRMAAGCSTSGLAFKLPGRVGDSPLVGHGVYCDGEAGGAAATGVGEEVIRVAGCYQVVEFLRQGLHPQQACERVVERILRRQGGEPKFVGFVALRTDGAVGFASTLPTLEAAVADGAGGELYPAPVVARRG